MINNFKKEYFFLSNFYPSTVKYEGLEYANVEAAFQAAKTTNQKERIAFAKENNPSIVKKMGRNILLRADWENVKEDIMYQLVYEKFSSHPELKKKLLETGSEDLVEGNYWHDNIWGNCSCPKCITRKGENRLGKILMQVRAELN